MTLQALIASHPDVGGHVNPTLVEAALQAAQCALACRVCADACLAEPRAAGLVQCIRLDLDCADICQATAGLAVRRAGSDDALIAEALKLCMRACAACAEECERHAEMHEHCQHCAEACRDCEAACRQALGSLTGQVQGTA